MPFSKYGHGGRSHVQNFSPLTFQGSHYENISCKYVQRNESRCRAKFSVVQPQGQNHGGSLKLTCKDWFDPSISSEYKV